MKTTNKPKHKLLNANKLLVKEVVLADGRHFRLALIESDHFPVSLYRYVRLDKKEFIGQPQVEGVTTIISIGRILPIDSSIRFIEWV